MKEEEKTKTMEQVKKPTNDGLTSEKSEEDLMRKYHEAQAKKQLEAVQNNTQILKIRNDLLAEKVENMELTIKQSNLLGRHKKAIQTLESYNKTEK